MKYSVFILFYILTVSQGNVIKGQQWTYSYKGQIDASSSACNKSYARWTVSGSLIGQSFDKYMVFKLENLKTSLFNGDLDNLSLSEEKNIPIEAEILHKPFVIHKNNDGVTIDVTPNEPLWSLNMKRAIGSHFQINFEQGFNGEFIEHSLYGDCPMNYISDKLGKDLIVNKIINHEKCKNNPFKHKTNVKKAEPTKNYSPLKIETVKKYFLKDVNSILVISDTYSISNLTYKPMPNIPNYQKIDQYQEFKMLNQSKIEEIINTDENSETHNIIYEIDMESIYGRQKKSDKQIVDLLENFDSFKKQFNSSLKHFNVKEDDYIDNMFLLLSNMKTDTLLKLNEELKGRDDLFNITLLTLLPYIGTNDTTNYIIKLLENNLNYEGSEYLGVKFLSTFPKYIEEPTEETIKQFEFLLEMKSNQLLKNAAILSFSNIVQNAIERNRINPNKIQDYKDMFYNKFKSEQLYETKMTYLLCLINIGDSLETNFIIEILENTSESNYLRALGMTGFTKRLIHESETTFDKFWAIVQNETESFDVRVAALDLLLSSNLNEKQFYAIVDVFKVAQKDIHHKHLFQFFHTKMITLQNSTRFMDPLGALATDLLQNQNFPNFRLNAHAWPTSNFRFAYTDEEPNFGRNIEAKLIGNPLTNSIDTLQISYNEFTMSFDLGTYSVYIKIDKMFERYYKKPLLHKLMETDLTITDLLDIIKKFHFAMKYEDIPYHMEIVIFVDYKAIFSVHINPENSGKMLEIINNGMSLTEDIQEKRISYPLMDYIAFPSDLGTSLTIKNDIQTIFAGQHPRMDLKMRYYWYHQIWLESYNPIIGTSISSYKYYGQEISVDFYLLHYNSFESTLAVHHSNDSFQMIDEKIIGTSASAENEEILKQYCAKCENYYDISNNEYYQKLRKQYELLSVSLNHTRGKNDIKNISEDYFSCFFNSHYSNADSAPTLRPFLLYWHFIDDQYYFHSELSRELYRSIPYYQNMTKQLFKFKNNHKENIDKQELMQASNYLNISIDVSSSSVDDDFVKLHWIATLTYQTLMKNINDINKPTIPQTYLNFDFDFIVYNESRFKLAIERELIFPKLNEDKFSLNPAEPLVGGTIIRYCNLPEDAPDCSTNRSIVMKEKFWVSEELKNSIQETAEYKTCQNEKVGYKFTPPTSSCVLYSHVPLHQYDNYEMFATFTYVSKIYDNKESDLPTLTYTMLSPTKMKLNLLKKQFFDDFNDEFKYWNNTINYWQLLANPNAIAYNDYEVLVGVKRSCVITSKKIKTLTGNYLDFNEEKPVAFVECFNKPLRGLTIQKIDNHKIGFKFWALNNTVIANIVAGDLKVTLNGNEITKTIYDEENKFKITFLSKDVVMIDESEIQIYYNTEYLYVKMLSMYNSGLCGFCSYDEN